MKPRLAIFLLLIFIMLSLFAWQPKICFAPDELFYYKSSQAISGIKDIYGPDYYGEKRFQKPPLFYLVVAFFCRIFGANWLSVRLVTIASAVLLLIVTYLLGLRMFGADRAFFGTGILATTILFFRFGRIVLPEMMLVFFMTGAFYFAYAGFQKNRRNLFYLSFCLMGIASLVKGPVGFILPAAAILLFSITSVKKDVPLRIPWAWGILIIIGSNLLWFLPAFLLFGKEFADHIVNVEIVDRMTREAGGLSFSQGVYQAFKDVFFYIPVLAIQFLPWSILCPAAMIIGRKNIEKKKFSVQRRFLIIWMITGFLMFTAVTAKRHHYVLLLFPALSLYLISFFDLELRHIRRMFRVLLSLTIGVYFLAVMVFFPYIFMDGVDHLSAELKKALMEEKAAVFASWRLDPQEIELYIDQPVNVIMGVEFEEYHMIARRLRNDALPVRRNGVILYLMIAREGYDKFLEDFLEYTAKTLQRPVTGNELSRGRRWRKTIRFSEFCGDIRANPWNIRKHFNKAFREDVFLVAVREE
ncbi:MAG: hypothetical protein DRP85_02605 [Candidatus Makaraimicrobium thalassicum]|nr:MAG: hypothetical protein DRP85_02605 [Candidatus Omnitrophota bacterium]